MEDVVGMLRFACSRWRLLWSIVELNRLMVAATLVVALSAIAWAGPGALWIAPTALVLGLVAPNAPESLRGVAALRRQARVVIRDDVGALARGLREPAFRQPTR